MSDSFNSRRTLTVNGKTFHYYSLEAAERAGLNNIHQLPVSLKVLLENQLRHEDDDTVTRQDILAFADWLTYQRSKHEIAYRPARVLMQDFTGVPAIVDLAAMRDAMAKMKGDPEKINPLCPVDLVIDHSVQVDSFGNSAAFKENVRYEMNRNHERYTFLKWGQQSFQNFQVVPPGTGICHQVNLEYLAKVAWSHTHNGENFVYPDTLVGTDSHTTMVNGLSVLGWGVGGIEAEAAMLGQPISMLIPEVVGFYLSGQLKEGITATDLVLTITQMLRQKSVVDKFVEFYGPGISSLSLADRATIANMAPEYGATCGFFPIDEETIKYLALSGRDEETIQLVTQYAKVQGLWHDENVTHPVFTETLKLDLSSVEPCLAGPKRPQDRVPLKNLALQTTALIDPVRDQSFPTTEGYDLHHGDVVIAAITSCTNTSNPNVMIAAALLAKKAIEQGLSVKPWVKASLAPGSKVVSDYLKKAGLMPFLETLGFYLVGYGCTTCIGNSGPLPEAITQTIVKNDLIVSSVLSGNRNFEGRIHPLVKANWLASPPLVVAFALAGTTRIDLTSEPLGVNSQNQKIYLKDVWPTQAEIADTMQNVRRDMFQKEYAEVFQGDPEWQSIACSTDKTFAWQSDSTYVKNPPYFDNMKAHPEPLRNIQGARILAIFGDSITTDHISPAGNIKIDSPAGQYLSTHGIAPADFNSYGARRGNHEVMMRGTFANIRIRNEMLPGVEGGFAKHFPSSSVSPIYDVAMQYQQEQVPLVIIAGKEYGTGSSRDWAAKGTRLLGIKAVIAESFERIHRSNLIGMGVLPLEFKPGNDRHSLKLVGDELIDLVGIEEDLTPRKDIQMIVHRNNSVVDTLHLTCRIDTQNELAYYQHGGILHFVLRKMGG